MKTTIQIIKLVVLIIIFSTVTGKAQMSDYKFNQQFNLAFEQVIEGEYGKAAVILKKLHETDAEHGQVAFLLGMCQVKTGTISEATKTILESACSAYDYNHQCGLATDRTAPARSWFYLAKAYAEMGNKREAINAYRNYMSCIPMASLDHKREIVRAIKELKRPDTVEGVSSIYATLKP